MTKIITPSVFKSTISQIILLSFERKKAQIFLSRLFGFYKDFKTKLTTLRKFHELTWALNLTYTSSTI